MVPLCPRHISQHVGMSQKLSRRSQRPRRVAPYEAFVADNQCQMGGTGCLATAYRTLRRKSIEDVLAKSGCKWTQAHVLACALGPRSCNGRTWQMGNSVENVLREGWTPGMDAALRTVWAAAVVWLRIRVTSRSAGGLAENNQLSRKGTLNRATKCAEIPHDNMLCANYCRHANGTQHP